MGDFIYQREYSLRQDTPLIHFQHEQKGACLRASEVKPQLDRFIHAFLCGQGADVPKTWYVARSKIDSVKALAYKLSISCDVALTKTTPPHKLYFGNMGENAQIKKQQTYSDVRIRFICFATGKVCLKNERKLSLLELIDYVLPAFFALSCFATRATKGFCSFIVKSGRKLDEEYLRQFAPVYYTIAYPTAPSGNEVLNDIWVIWGMMKSGFNLVSERAPDDYYKGRIFRYFSEQEIGSEKAFIKQHVLTLGTDSNKKSEEYRVYKRFVFSRAMLGLAQQYSFRSGPKTTRQGKVTVSAETDNPVVRFASPVRFVPNGNMLLILPVKIPQHMYNAKFRLNSQVISTPSQDEFDLIEYLDWFCGEFNARKEIENFVNSNVRPTIQKQLRIERHPQLKGGDANA